jgi:hypothetical protein
MDPVADSPSAKAQRWFRSLFIGYGKSVTPDRE